MAGAFEAAKSGRSKCRRCQELLPKGEPRFGELVPNPYGEGETSLWFHPFCGAEKFPESVKDAVGATELEIADREELLASCEAGLANPKLAEVLGLQVSPSGRAKCRQCSEVIAKGELRVVKENEGDDMAMPTKSYVHLACAALAFGAAGLLGRLERHATSLDEEQRAVLTETIKE